MRISRTNKGFTLVELMVVLAIVAIVATVAVPAYSEFVRNNQRTAAVNDMLGLLNYARSEAIKRGIAVEIEPSGSSYSACHSGCANSADYIRVMQDFPGDASITRTDGGSTNLRFRGSGMSNSGNVVYRVCVESGADGVQIAVNGGGQISKLTATVTCP